MAGNAPQSAAGRAGEIRRHGGSVVEPMDPLDGDG
jgi:hypothetical protein